MRLFLWCACVCHTYHGETEIVEVVIGEPQRRKHCTVQSGPLPSQLVCAVYTLYRVRIGNGGRGGLETREMITYASKRRIIKLCQGRTRGDTHISNTKYTHRRYLPESFCPPSAHPHPPQCSLLPDHPPPVCLWLVWAQGWVSVRLLCVRMVVTRAKVQHRALYLWCVMVEKGKV